MYQPKSIYTETALNSILENFSKGKKISTIPEELKVKAACFVTLYKISGELRGCIGTLEPFRENLYEEIWGNAKSAAFSDPRFSKLKEAELDEIEISVDVLEKAERVEGKDKLDPKIYGVIVSSGGRRGVLLPDIEGVDSVEEQLSIARMKGGIGPGEKAVIYRFKVKRYH